MGRRVGGRGYGWMGGRLYTYRYTVTTRMTSALRWAAMRAILMFNNCDGQSHKTVSTDHNFWRERIAEADSNWGPFAYQRNALLQGQTGSQNRKKSAKRLRKYVKWLVIWCQSRSMLCRFSGVVVIIFTCACLSLVVVVFIHVCMLTTMVLVVVVMCVQLSLVVVFMCVCLPPWY